MINTLSRDEKRKYALARKRIEYGCYGHKLSVFRSVTLTTREGHDQSTKRFGRDLQKLIGRFRKMGFKVDYCGCYELTLAKELLHWHGLLRIGRGGYFPITRRMLGDLWNELHGAFAVDIKPVTSWKKLWVYIAKHMIKDYLNTDGRIRNKFLFSRNWIPDGIPEFVKDFKNWWTNCFGLIWMDKAGYAILNTTLKEVIAGKKIIIRNNNGYLIAHGLRIMQEVIYELEDTTNA